MSIQSEINRITSNIASAYTAAAEKNATMPAQQNSENLATTILSIPAGAELPELTNPGTSADLLAGKQLISEDGIVVNGSMPVVNESLFLRPSMVPYTPPVGYHDGTEEIYVTARTLNITPKKEVINYKHDTYVTAVTVNPIPDQYQDVTPVTATAADVVAGKVFVDSTGAVVTGTLDLSVELSQQASLIEDIKTTLQEKAAGGASEYYTITNNTGLDLVICDHVVTAGTTVDIPVDADALTEVGGYLLMYTWTGNIITPTKSYIVATVNGSVPAQSPKNRINRLTFYVGPTMACTVFMAGVDIATAGTTLTAPASGSTIVLTLSA